jgi:hypothetical protein
MTCHDARALFSDWTDDALSAADRAHLDAHLQQCAECRKELERFSATLALLHRIERPRAPGGFVDRVLATTSPVPWYRRLLQRLLLPLSVKLPAEVVALLLVAGLAVYVFQRTPELQRAAHETREPAAPGAAPPAWRPPAPEAPRAALGDASAVGTAGKGRRALTREDAGRSAPSTPAPPSPQSAPSAGAARPRPVDEREALQQRAQPSVESRNELDRQGAAAQFSAQPPDSRDRPALSEEVTKTAPLPGPAAGGAAPALRAGRETEAKKEAVVRGLAAPTVPPAAPSEARPVPTEERAADALSERTARLPARAPAPSSSAARVPPSANVVGQLTVKDRSAAEQALEALLGRSGGRVISRRDDAGATLVEVAVPRTAYPEFSRGLARLGAWRPEGEPAELPADVRVTVRLVQ